MTRKQLKKIDFEVYVPGVMTRINHILFIYCRVGCLKIYPDGTEQLILNDYYDDKEIEEEETITLSTTIATESEYPQDIRQTVRRYPSKKAHRIQQAIHNILHTATQVPPENRGRFNICY